jgi:L-ascorbate metabolism protein UlaG (beta-lactamase superfamily)
MTWRTYTDLLKHNRLALRIADRLGRGRGTFRWLDALADPPPPRLKPDLSNWHRHNLAAAWIGHATVLLRIGGMTVLTDPVFSTRIGLGMGLFTAGPMRKFAPALAIDELPRLDLILISHAHFDHLDRPTLARLPKNVQVVTSWQTRDLLDDLGFQNVTELHWGERLTIGPLTIRAHEVRHWGARVFFDEHRGYNAYFLETDHRRVLYAADTAYGNHFRNAGKVDLGIFNISAYNPYIQAHAAPEQVWQMAADLPTRFVLPAHHGTFNLSHEPMDEPLRRLLAAAGNDADRIIIREVGEMWSDGIPA